MSVVFVDRESAYPNRYRVIPDSGNAYTVILERDDEPIAPGTPLNAETFNALVSYIDSKDPAIYGLGVGSWRSGAITRIDDPAKLDTMKTNGFWAYQKSGSPLESNYTDTQFMYGYTVASGNTFVTQRAVTVYTGVWIERTLGLRNSNGEWSPWKYVNPPMVEGKTYLTTEFFLSKPVYKTVMNLGEFPAGESGNDIQMDGFNSSNAAGGVTGGTTSVASEIYPISCKLMDKFGTTFNYVSFTPDYISFMTPPSYKGGTIHAVLTYTMG